MAGLPIRVLLVDDHPAILEAIGAAVGAAADLTLAGTARTLDAALRLATGPRAVACDVVVTDVQLAGEAEGLRLLDAVGSGGPAVLLLSSFDQPPLIRTAFERGAAGYVLKTSEVTEVLTLVCGGASNDEVGARLGVSEKTVESHLRRLFDRYGVLSRTELAVLALREGWVAEKARP